MSQSMSTDLKRDCIQGTDNGRKKTLSAIHSMITRHLFVNVCVAHELDLHAVHFRPNFACTYVRLCFTSCFIQLYIELPCSTKVIVNLSSLFIFFHCLYTFINFSCKESSTPMTAGDDRLINGTSTELKRYQSLSIYFYFISFLSVPSFSCQPLCLRLSFYFVLPLSLSLLFCILSSFVFLFPPFSLNIYISQILSLSLSLQNLFSPYYFLSVNIVLLCFYDKPSYIVFECVELHH